MIDIHAHILPGLDDGSKSMKETIEMLKKAEENNITDIFCTTHYKERYARSVETLEETLDLVIEEAKKENIKINIHKGREIMITPDSLKLIQDKKLETLGDTDYILIEFNLHFETPNVEKIIEKIILSGYKVIIAHPERYEYVQRNLNYVKKYIDAGAYLQINMESIFCGYGKNAEKTAIKLLKKNAYSICGSDIHFPTYEYNVEKFINKTKRILWNDRFEKLLETNSCNLLNNLKLERLKFKD